MIVLREAIRNKCDWLRTVYLPYCQPLTGDLSALATRMVQQSINAADAAVQSGDEKRMLRALEDIQEYRII